MTKVFFPRVLAAAAVVCLTHAAGAAGIRAEIAAEGDVTVGIAADEFRKYYREITGRAAEGDRRIRLAVDPSMSADGRDAYSIVSDAEGAVLTGGNPRSVLYAVYDLLERRGGCHWFWDGDVVPKADELDLAGLDVHEKSRFEFRATRYFAHRGLTRFRAQQWGPDDWKREIDYLAKIRVNTFMLRIGQDDMFQLAFPDVCEYPDPSKPLPGTGTGYDNLSPFWSLQFRGLLRRMVLAYGRDRGMMIPEDFGTMTHWYSRTPQDFLDRMKPDFLPQSTSGYSEPSGLVWDIRQEKWMDAYWRLTDAAIRNYGRPDVLHTMGLSERNCYSNRADNLKLKIDVMKRLCAGAKARYPSSRVILGGWDFHHTWFPQECAALWPQLREYGAILWDYEADAIKNYRPEMPRANNLTKWDVIGKFPYTFGFLHAFARSSDIRANYPVIEERWKAVGDDPMCKGYIWWPEVVHGDILFYNYFAANSWRPGTSVEKVLPEFCRKRYGVAAAEMNAIWDAGLPITVGVDWYELFAPVVTRAAREFEHPELWSAPSGNPTLNAAPELYRRLSGLDWADDFVRRDSIDLARTVGDRLTVATATKLFNAYHAWRAGKASAAELTRLADAYAALGAAMADTLALHTDFSLWESYVRLDRVEKVRNPDFTKVLVDNASCGYCRSYQYECAEHWYRHEMKDLATAVKKKVSSGDRVKRLFVWDAHYRERMLATPLESMRPQTPRTAENFRKAMMAFKAAAELAVPFGEGEAFNKRLDAEDNM